MAKTGVFDLKCMFFWEKANFFALYRQSAVWTYKLIYIYNEEQAGQWSDEVSVTVYGEV